MGSPTRGGADVLSTGSRGQHLLGLLSTSSIIDRERSRSILLLASLAIVGITLVLPQPAKVHGPAAGVAVLCLVATFAASCARRLMPIMNRVSGTLIALEITSLIAVSGGARSPYTVLYALLLLYAAMFYSTRRLLITGGLVAALATAPYVLVSDVRPGHQTELLVRLAVWVVMCTVVHVLVTQLRARSRELAEQRQQYRSLFDHNPDAVFALDAEGRFTAVNAAGYELVGYSAADLLGQPFDRLLAEQETADARQHFAAALSGEPQSYRSRLIVRDGSTVEIAVTNLPILIDGQVLGVYGIAKDISAYSALEEALTRQALHDPLTGLANRSLLKDRLEQALAGRERSGERVSLLMLDLDEFKQVNDTLGHAAGDAVLVEVAARLCRSIRAGDTVARLGGDEFALVLPKADACGAAVVADRILAEMHAPIPVGGELVTIGSSVGISSAERPDIDAAALLSQADQALYAAKRGGRGQRQTFHPDLRTETQKLPEVSVEAARSWADYMRALRADIEQSKDLGDLPAAMRAPASLHRTLEKLLGSIDRLPADAECADLPLPERTALEDFFFHQSAVNHWTDDLVRDGVLRTRRPPAADRFWGQLKAAVTAPS